MALMQCVPNLSEGRNAETLAACRKAIDQVPGSFLLHEDVGAAANRSVFTLAGEPEAVTEAAFRLYERAHVLIDMRQQKGVHPRIGAVDVCPLVPLADMKMAEAVYWSRQLAKRLADELQLGGYFYEDSAWPGKPKRLSQLRKGQYEGLNQQLSLRPLDFGTAERIETFGLTCVGARKVMAAYNLNLKSQKLATARRIAGRLRESGPSLPDDKNAARYLKGVRSLGWYIDDFDCCQVSCNLMDLEANGLWEVFTAAQEEAKALHDEITGSELIGLIPRSELIKVGRQRIGEASEAHLMAAAVEFLGLDALAPFDLDKRVIETVYADRKAKARYLK